MADKSPEQALEHVLNAISQACTPSAQDYRNREDVIGGVRRALNELRYVSKDVQPYGSFVSGFFKGSSDLDLAFMGYVPRNTLNPRALSEIEAAGHVLNGEYVPLSYLDKSAKAEILRRAAEQLRRRHVAKPLSTQYVLHARVPIIKFKDSVHDIDCDLCIGDERTAFKAAFVKQLSLIDERFGALFRVAKAWAKAHYMNDGANHTFNSWCLTLVVAFYLQQRQPAPLLPPFWKLFYSSFPGAGPRLMSKGSTANLPAAIEIASVRAAGAREEYGAQQPLGALWLLELFSDFIATMGPLLRQSLTQPHRCLCTWTGELQPNRRDFAKRYALLVEDPFDDQDNVARTFGTLEDPAMSLGFVVKVIEQTHDVLKGIRAGELPLGPGLGWLFGPALLSDVPQLVPAVFPAELAAWARAEGTRVADAGRATYNGNVPAGAAIAAAGVAALAASQDLFQQFLSALACPYELLTISKFRDHYTLDGQPRGPGRKGDKDGRGRDRGSRRERDRDRERNGRKAAAAGEAQAAGVGAQQQAQAQGDVAAFAAAAEAAAAAAAAATAAVGPSASGVAAFAAGVGAYAGAEAVGGLVPHGDAGATRAVAAAAAAAVAATEANAAAAGVQDSSAAALMGRGGRGGMRVPPGPGQAKGPQGVHPGRGPRPAQSLREEIEQRPGSGSSVSLEQWVNSNSRGDSPSGGGAGPGPGLGAAVAPDGRQEHGAQVQQQGGYEALQLDAGQQAQGGQGRRRRQQSARVGGGGEGPGFAGFAPAAAGGAEPARLGRPAHGVGAGGSIGAEAAMGAAAAAAAAAAASAAAAAAVAGPVAAAGVSAAAAASAAASALSALSVNGGHGGGGQQEGGWAAGPVPEWQRHGAGGAAEAGYGSSSGHWRAGAAEAGPAGTWRDTENCGGGGGVDGAGRGGERRSRPASARGGRQGHGGGGGRGGGSGRSGGRPYKQKSPAGIASAWEATDGNGS